MLIAVCGLIRKFLSADLRLLFDSTVLLSVFSLVCVVCCSLFNGCCLLVVVC